MQSPQAIGTAACVAVATLHDERGVRAKAYVLPRPENSAAPDEAGGEDEDWDMCDEQSEVAEAEWEYEKWCVGRQSEVESGDVGIGNDVSMEGEGDTKAATLEGEVNSKEVELKGASITAKSPDGTSGQVAIKVSTTSSDVQPPTKPRKVPNRSRLPKPVAFKGTSRTK